MLPTRPTYRGAAANYPGPVSERPPSTRNAITGGALLAVAGLILIRAVGPVRLLSVLFLAGGAFYLNRTDPKRLTAVLLVVVGGLAWVVYQTASRQR